MGDFVATYHYERLVRAALRLVAPGWGTPEKVKFRLDHLRSKKISYLKKISFSKKILRFEKNLKSHKNSPKKMQTHISK